MGTRITQSSFTRGELTPRLDARTNLEQREIGLRTAKNGFVHQEGGISNRMGLEYCGTAIDSTKAVRLMKFVFNAEQTYMLEFGNYTMRVIYNGGYVENNGQIYQIATPYPANVLDRIKRSQSGDVLTLTHPNYKTRTLSRYGHTDWRFAETVIVPDIAQPTNATASYHWGQDADQTKNTRYYKYRVTAVDGDTNEESKASSATAKEKGHREANWLSDEYMTISWNRVEGAAEYNVYRQVNGIYAYIGTANQPNSGNPSFTDDNIEPDLTATVPIYKNPFSGTGNRPSCSGYFQQRMVFASSYNNPQTLWASKTAAIHNFSYSRPLVATDAITLNMDDREVNEIRHLVPMKDLLVFTSTSEWKVNGTDGIFQATPVPASVVQSYYGSSHVEPIISGSMVLFVQAGGSVIRDLGYDIMTEGYDGEELTIFSSHLFEGKEITYMAYAKEPWRLLYVVFKDGTGAVMTYNKKQKLCGWCQLVTDGKFECVDVVREGLEDVAYFVVKRYINGQWRKYIERTRTRVINNAKDAFLVDSGFYKEIKQKYTGTYTLVATGENYNTYSIGNDGVFSEEEFRIDTVYSAEELNIGTILYSDTELSQKYGIIKSLSNSNITIYEAPYTRISGLEHLEGKQVICNVNGGIVAGLTVHNGSITLPKGKEASTIIVGLPYEFEFETLPIEGENTHGLKKLVNYVSVITYTSREDFLFCGNDGSEFRHSRCDDSINHPEHLYSKDISSTVFALPSSDVTIKIKQNYPLPLTILSVSADVDVQDNENN